MDLGRRKIEAENVRKLVRYSSKDWWSLIVMLIVGGVIVAFVTEWFLEWCK